MLSAAMLLLATTAGGLPVVWSEDGHRIVCEIAFREMREQTRQRVLVLLGRDREYTRFPDSCAWADAVRGRVRDGLPGYQRFDRLNDAHFINIPFGATGLDSVACTRVTAGVRRPCVLDAITEYSNALRTSPTDSAKLEALKLLAHFVGDLHQPLHAGYPSDLGGNRVTVKLAGGGERNLHSVWDGFMIQRAGKEWLNYADFLRRDITPIDRKLWRAVMDPRVWVLESFQAVEDDVYDDLLAADGTRTVDDRYYFLNRRKVEERLKQAGVRLALLLDQLLAPSR